MGRELKRYEQIERSIIKKYRKQIWNPFVEAVKNYKLIEEGDKIAVCISGGKDSMLMAKLLQQLQKYSEVNFDVVYLVMDPGYNAVNRAKIENNAKILNIPLTIFETNIFDVANNMDKSPCYLCARMRRGHLYSKAREYGCNKIALGHHKSDVIETTLMGMMYGAQIQGMLPRLKSTNFKGMELIRPMYCILEDNVISWMKYNNLEFIQCACKLTEGIANNTDGIHTSKRHETKLLIKELKKVNPNIENNLFKSIHNVNVDTMVGYKIEENEYSFLGRFSNEEKGK